MGTRAGAARIAAAIAAAAGLGGTQVGLPQQAQDLTVDVGECVDLASPEERFACYERQVEAARRRAAPPASAPAAEPATPPAAASAVPPAAPPAPATPTTAADPPPPTPARATPATASREETRAAGPARSAAGSASAGATPARVEVPAEEPRRRRAARDEEFANAPEFQGTVTALRETVPNSYTITLDNGQVWRQTHPVPYPLRIGHRVRIYPTRRWGYRLAVEELNGFIRVERVR